MRSDYRVLETFVNNAQDKKIECNISVLIGNEDIVIDGSINQWHKYTYKNCNFKYFDGSHFFIYEQCDKVAEYIEQCINKNCNMDVNLIGGEV